MKKAILTILLYSFIISSNAQTNFEGVVIYDINYIQVPAELEQYRSMLPTTMKIYVKGSKSRLEQELGGGNSQVIISDLEKSEGMVAMNMMGQKILIRINPEQFKQSMEDQKNVEIEYIDESLQIAGYECKKAIIQQEENKIVAFYTDELPNSSMKQFANLKGMPLQYEIIQNGMTLKLIASSVSKEAVANELFDAPGGYNEVSLEQMQMMSGGNFKF